MNASVFKELQAYWYAKLVASGFRDIETDMEGIEALEVRAGNTFRNQPQVLVEARGEYHTAMSAHLDDESLSVFDRIVLKLLLAGETRTSIAKQLGRHPRTIRYHIRHLETRFGVRHWNKGDMCSTPKKHKALVVVRRTREQLQSD